MSDVQLWFPICRECKIITKFPGRKDLDPSEIKCQECGAVCEDANDLIERGELKLECEDPEGMAEILLRRSESMGPGDDYDPERSLREHGRS